MPVMHVVGARPKVGATVSNSMPPKKESGRALPPPQMTFWMYSKKGVALPERERAALKALLENCTPARVTVQANGTVHACFRTWAQLHAAERGVIDPLVSLLSNAELRSAYDNPFDFDLGLRRPGEPRPRTCLPVAR